MVYIYYLTGTTIDKKQTFATWEDAYIFVSDFAEKNEYEMCADGAEKKATNQFLKICNNQNL